MVWLRNEPIKEELRVYPKEITEPLKNVYVVDFGQNMVGWCRIFGNAKKAENIIIQYGEALNEDGTLYTENLRGAQQTDIYKPSNTGMFAFEPRFTYHGFRYIQIHGLSDKPSIDSIFGRVIHSSSPFVSNFQCSDSSLNKLMENIRWTQRGNLMSSPNDCPQRDERFGWMGDIQIFAQTGIFNMDLAAFLTKFLIDTRDDQADDGRFPDFAPHPGNPNLDFSGAPGWGDAAVFVPWITYVNYADEQILKDQFSAACRWIKYIHRNNPDYIWRNGRNRDYNDWLNGDKIIHEEWPKEGAEIPNEIFATAFFYKSTQIVARMADIIHRPVESKYYGQLADSIKTAFIKNFVKEDGFITGNTQAGYALALNFELLPPEQRSNALEHMIKNIRQDYNGHLSTGIQTSVRALLELTSMGHNDIAWELILKRTFPSWMYMIDNGATTIWERWDGYVKGRGFQSPGMNSLNHWALGAVGEWMWKNIIGLNPDENQPGWKHFTIAPKPGGGLNWAKGDYVSIRGRILSSWEIKDKKFFLEIEVPPNCTATVQIPTTDVNNITMDGNSIKAESYKEGFAGFKVLSGKYSFVSPY
jgi:alpha-L-rhamnosidase